MSAPLRIGVLGASRIAELSIIEAAGETGDVLAAVAARHPERAREYAERWGFAAAAENYEALIADDSLDLVYVGLPNGLHAEWTARALEAGRNVLVEKPFASNLAEFDRVAARLGNSTGWAWEAFHYADHPLTRRVIEILLAGEIGAVREVHVRLRMPEPPATDPRWSFDLAGGANMDLGCYTLNVLLTLGDALGVPVTLQSASGEPYAGDARVDASVEAMLSFGEARGTIQASMVNDGWDFWLEVEGERGSILSPNVAKPQEDDRLVVRSGDERRIEHVGTVSSYTYQLLRIREAVRSGERDAQGLDRSRRTMALIDELYIAAGFPLRPAHLAD